MPLSVPVKRAPPAEVSRIAVPESPSNWPVPFANRMVSCSVTGLPYEMAPAWSWAVPDGRGQKTPVSGPAIVLSSDCSVIENAPSNGQDDDESPTERGH